MSVEKYECPLNGEYLARLERAIAEGVKEVEYNDKKITYRTLDEMFKIAKYIRIKLGLHQGKSSRRGLFGGRRLTMRPSKGLNDCHGSKEHGEHEKFDRNEDID